MKHTLPILAMFAFLVAATADESEQTEYEKEFAALPADPEMDKTLVARFGWPILTTEAANRMASFAGDRGAVDFGAGAGYLAYLLADRGVDALAIDDWSWGQPDRTWYLVQTGSYELLEGTQDRILILSWPPRHDPMALRALQAWGGERLIYIGEILCGTADPAFHKELADNWRLVDRVKIPNWRNRTDEVFLFEHHPGTGIGMDWMMSERSKC